MRLIKRLGIRRLGLFLAVALTAPAYGADDFDAKAASALRNINSELRRIATTPVVPAPSNNFSQQKTLKNKAFALPVSPLDGGAVVPVAPPEASDVVRQKEALNDEDALYNDVLSDCEGRYASNAATLRRDMNRQEKIAVFGASAGMLGTIAACPHCAAFLSGVAAVTNALQQALRETGDTPQASRAQLDGLSAQILADLKVYNALPDPRAATNSTDFYIQMGKRVSQLRLVKADCNFFRVALNQAKAVSDPPVSSDDKPANASPAK